MVFKRIRQTVRPQQLPEQKTETVVVQTGPLLPPEELRFRVGGVRDAEEFQAIGGWCRDSLLAGLTKIGRDFTSFGRILDFGCGCGRTLLSFAEITSLARFHATDIDAKAVGWCCANLPLASCGVNDPLPPLAQPDGAFDLVYAISVFTHLDEERQFLWLDELRRITQPGGIVLLSVHGEHCRGVMIPERVAEIEAAGFLFATSEGFKGLYPDWYQMTFHTREYVLDRFDRYFAVKAYIPKGMSNYQDLVVLERR
jgi:2-polyprenyl-3-methyl-5-hydroxy-6-metoxy-1,4-benzoquinol methylase